MKGSAIPADNDPIRQCAVSRERLPQSAMIRFVSGPDGQVVPDVGNKLPGRGVWITASRDHVAEAIRKGAFSRGLKVKAGGDPDLPDRLEALLLARCQGILGMAKRSGEVILGFDQVRNALRKAPVAWLLEASDGAEDGRRKVYSLANALYDRVRVAGGLASEELGMAFGRSRVIHGALQNGSLAKAWTIAYGRLTGFRPAPEDHWFTPGDRQDNPERAGGPE
ncbi:MAG: RNA-binding protein [Pseudomonadota bacterium]